MNYQLAVLARVQSDLLGQPPIATSEFEVTIEDCISFLRFCLAFYESQVLPPRPPATGILARPNNTQPRGQNAREPTPPDIESLTVTQNTAQHGAPSIQTSVAGGHPDGNPRRSDRIQSNQSNQRVPPLRPATAAATPTRYHPYPAPSSRNLVATRTRSQASSSAQTSASAKDTFAGIEDELIGVADFLNQDWSSKDFQVGLPDVAFVATQKCLGGISMDAIFRKAGMEALTRILALYQNAVLQGERCDVWARIRNILWKLGYIHCYLTIQR